MIKTYVDAGILIEAYRGASSLAAQALAILTDPNRLFVTSEFVRPEVRPKPVYFGRVQELAFYDAFFAGVAERPVSISRARSTRAAARRVVRTGRSGRASGGSS